MAKLNQLIAVEKGVKDEQGRAITNAYHVIEKADSVVGIARTYEPLVDGDAEVLPPESKKVPVNIKDVIKGFTTEWSRLMDVVASKDITNTTAAADLVVDGVTVAKKVPVTTLLWLEKQLVDLATVVSKLPTLELGREWTFDDSANAYASEPVSTLRTKKILKNHVIYEATKEHPAQVTTFQEDVVVGTWTTVHYSGAIQAKEKFALAEKISKLQKAVKFAREDANNIQATDSALGKEIFTWLLA